MFLRWFIRGSFLLALAFVVGAWIASYFGAFIEYIYAGDGVWEVGGVRGLVFFCRIPDPHAAWRAPHFQFFPHATVSDVGINPPIFGFQFGAWPHLAGSFLAAYPLWLATLMVAGLCWLVWWKTRAKGMGGAFPVEPSQVPANAR